MVHVHDHAARVNVTGQLQGRLLRRRDAFVGQGHALPPGHDLGRAAPGGREAGGPADGHRVARRRWPEAAAPDHVRGARGRRDAGKANGALDRRAPAHRARGAGQSRLQYRFVAERQVAVDVIVWMFGVRVVVTAGQQHGPGPVAAHGRGRRHLEPVATVLVAVAMLAGGLAARVPGLAREHDGDGHRAVKRTTRPIAITQPLHDIIIFF